MDLQKTLRLMWDYVIRIMYMYHSLPVLTVVSGYIRWHHCPALPTPVPRKQNIDDLIQDCKR